MWSRILRLQIKVSGLFVRIPLTKLHHLHSIFVPIRIHLHQQNWWFQTVGLMNFSLQTGGSAEGAISIWTFSDEDSSFLGSWHSLSVKKSKKSPTGPTGHGPLNLSIIIARLQPCTPLKTNGWKLEMMGTPSSFKFSGGVRMCNSINVDSINTHTIHGCLVYLPTWKP